MKNVSIVQSPAWVKDLIIYEIATKGFTSPNGPESGTFNSLREKMEYLRELGITCVWLTGSQWSQPDHFYGIWNQYACIRPDMLDPSLGTRDDFKGMIDEAHRCGIRIVLDVITHGVMNESPLIREKPHWFKGGSWGMTDYDWCGGHGDLDEWWVDTWVGLVRDFHVDGFRLDVAIGRFDLWSLIRKKALELGHEIVVFPEFAPATAGVTDFTQDGCRLSRGGRLSDDVAGFIGDAVARRNLLNMYKVKITYADGSVAESHTGDLNALAVAYEGEYKELKQCKESAYVEHGGILRVDNVCIDKKISHIVVYDGERYGWELGMTGDRSLRAKGKAPTLRLNFPLRKQDGQYLSIMLSSHDYGWEGFPAGQNPYFAQGSRCLFGYAFLFAPAIPIFMSGEEFNADFVPLPKLTPKLYGGLDHGKGTWLYGSWIQWDQLASMEKQEMLTDVKKMIGIRRRAASLIRPFRMGEEAMTLLHVDCESDRPIPVPYMYYDKNRMLIVAGNADEYAGVEVKFKMPVPVVENLPSGSLFKVSDLWNGKEAGMATAAEFEDMTWTISKDRSAGGGLLVLELKSEGMPACRR